MSLSPGAKAGLGLALVALAGPAGFVLYRGILGGYQPLVRDPVQPGSPQAHVAGSPAAGPGASSPSATGGPATASPASVPAAAPTAALPTVLPDLALPDAAGTLHRLREYRGKPLLLNFWASWCEPCRREMPLFESLHRNNANSVQIVGVAIDFQADALKFAQSQGIDYPLLMGEKGGLAAANAVGVREMALPFTVIADGAGNIVTIKFGELHRDEADLLLARLADLANGHLDLPGVRRELSAGWRNLAVIRAKGSP